MLQSSHRSWLFVAEAALYGHSVFPTALTAMTVGRWREVTGNSADCSQLVLAQSAIAEDYRQYKVLKFERLKW